jgi:hypothetical protein
VNERNVRIRHRESGELVNAIIRRAVPRQMPSLHDGWRFNFDRHSRPAHTYAYLLVLEDSPEVIQGALIFQLLDGGVLPYMAYVETAPHNKGNQREYDEIAGCLIAHAFTLTFIYGRDPYQGQLFFDVLEENPEDQERLVQLYREKYGALRLGETRLLIIDDFGEVLVARYLERE